MAKRVTKVEEREPDAGAAQAAFGKVEAELRALPAAALQIPNRELQDAAVAGLALADIARAPKRKARFDGLSAGTFPAGRIEALEQAALAAWFVQTKVLSESAGSGGAKVDFSLMQESEQHLGEMLKLIDYHVGDIDQVAVELADIRGGSGYHDRASDLVRTAQLFEAWQDELADDPRRYDPNAAKQARAYADRILEALRQSVQASAEWADMRNRAWTHLDALYKDVQTTGAWLFRNEPEDGDLFVPIRRMIDLVRPRRRPGTAAAATPEVVPTAGE